MSNAIVDEILDMLQHDIVSNGIISQCLRVRAGINTVSTLQLSELLSALLSTDVVAIGTAKLAGPDYVEFIAWNGSDEEKVSRAIAKVSSCDDSNSEFAYWLCLKKNVDRFEETSAGDLA